MSYIVWPSGAGLQRVGWQQPQTNWLIRSGWSRRTYSVESSIPPRWSASGVFPAMTTAQALAWRGFAFQLVDPDNWFRLPAVEADQHSGTIVATAYDATTAAGNLTLRLKGFAASTTILSAGHLLTVLHGSGDEQLIGLTAALTSDGAGVATAYLATPLRELVAADYTVEIKRPWGRMRPSDPVQWSVEPAMLYGHTLECEEAF